MQAVFPPLDSRASPNGVVKPPKNNAILVDTSAIIDGRIADLTVTGFVDGSLVVPRFILDELRHIADSSDPLRRNLGRRGLEVLGRLRQEPNISLEVLDVGVQHSAEVDSELVHLARSMKRADTHHRLQPEPGSRAAGSPGPERQRTGQRAEVDCPAGGRTCG